MHNPQYLHSKMKPLTRLQEIRIKRLEKAYHEKRQTYAEAKEVVDQRQASIDDLKAKRSSAFQYLSQNDVVAKSECHTLADTHRYWLEYDLGKDEYYLPGEQQDMEEAETAMTEAHKEWLRSRAKKQGMEKQTAKLKQAINKLEENKQELEMEEAFSG